MSDKKNNIFGWVRFGLAALLAVVAAVLFVSRSQASQDVQIMENRTHVQGLTKALNGSLEKIDRNISAMSAQVSETKNAVVRIETLQAVQAEDIRELKGTAKELRDR